MFSRPLFLRTNKRLFIIFGIFLFFVYILYLRKFSTTLDYLEANIKDKVKMTLQNREDMSMIEHNKKPPHTQQLQHPSQEGFQALHAIIASLDLKPPSASVEIMRKEASVSEDMIRVKNMLRAQRYVPPQILVHFDFKGAPPKLKYLLQLFPLLRQMGATGLLIEYEDMFPYWGSLTSISAKNAFSYEDVQVLVAMAKKNQLEVIPLIQTFGHMEFVLKGTTFKGLREVPSYPQAICPSREESMTLIQDMIDQTIALHPGIKRLHIGCDEVYHLGRCRTCNRKVANNSQDYREHPKSYLFLNHVRQVATYVKQNYRVQPIVWDDMFRGIPSEYIIKSNVHGGLVEPMIWVYSTRIYEAVNPEVWEKYADVFPNFWAAGAFKGATGETSSLPDAYQHVLNTAEWLTTIRRESLKFNHFRGYVLTGWQRYDHFSVLCELLPVAVPSLALTLLSASHGKVDDKVLKNASIAMSCTEHNLTPTVDMLPNDHYLRHFATCNFPGSHAFHIVRTLQTLKMMVGKHLRTIMYEDGWFNAYNIARNFSNPFRVKSAAQKTTTLLRSVTSLSKNAAHMLSRYFESETIDEWIEQQIQPLITSLLFVDSKVKPILERSIWPRRPLT